MSIQEYNLTPLGFPRRYNGMCPSCWALWKDGEPAPSDCAECGPAWTPHIAPKSREGS